MDSPIETGLENTADSCGLPHDSNSFEEISSVSGLDHDVSSPVTPKSDRIPVAFDFINGGSDVSLNRDYDSSDSELDSEAEAFYSSLNYHLVSPGRMDGENLVEKQMSYGELMKRFVECEEELRTKSLKLQESEQEIDNLKGENENLRAELEARGVDIETEKRCVPELQKLVVDLETKLSDSRFEFERLANELDVSRGCLVVSDAEISKLREMLCDSEQSFTTEKAKLETDITGLLEKQRFFEEVLEDQIRHWDEEKMEFQRKEIQLQGEINALKTDLASRDEQTEALNKDFDNHKVRYDMLMAEKDVVCAELDNLKAAMRSRDIQIAHLRHKLVNESETAKNIVEELKAVVKELEKQAEMQRQVITEGEEEKREAIRQLCFSLDHYKTEYRQLLQFLSSKNKQQQASMLV